MAKAKIKAALDFFDGKRQAEPEIPVGFFSARQWAIRLRITDVKYVRYRLEEMVLTGLAEMFNGKLKGQRTVFYKVKPFPTCKKCGSLLKPLPPKIFLLKQ